MIFFSRVIFNFIQLSIFSFLIKDADLKLVRCRNPWGEGKNVCNELNDQAFMTISQMPFKGNGVLELSKNTKKNICIYISVYCLCYSESK